ncbi:MAG TPA: alkaline phosphatase family protein [Candidatus Limnocylindrales bacterium]|nr:alkaline phosphatase family protein [Candidatus Limnocylindrales bacterium]
MKKIALFLLAVTALMAATPPKPKLVLAIVIDQFRYDYLTRFRAEYTAGFNRLLTRGAVFNDARYVHFPTVTAVGHSTFLTGATPSISGIVGNDWYDREEQKHVTSVSDSGTKLLGDTGDGSSPHRLLVDTIGDELKMSDHNKSHVVGISLKDRAAILPAGHSADAAYWFDPKVGNFVSSTYYFADLPGWVKDFNSAHPADKFAGVKWLSHTMPQSGKPLYDAIDASPFGNELVEAFAERALQAEQLGKHDATDVLTVSFSSNDYVGHAHGPYSDEEHEVTVRTDKVLERLFQAVESSVGLDNVLVVLTGDHGVAPSAEEDKLNHMPGGRLPGDTVKNAVNAALVSKYGDGNWVKGSWDLSIYLDRDLIESKHLDAAEVRRTAARAAFGVQHVFRVYTYDQMLAGAISLDDVGRRVTNGFNERRSPDLTFLPEPYWMFGSSTTTHGTTFSYDNHVPVIFMGSGIRPGRYSESIIVNDIAPTLASILDVEAPSGSVGRILSEMFQ